MSELPKAYNPKDVEDEIYQRWEASGFFNPDNLPGKRKEKFSILMPPTNANGNLHAGHALVMTIEDILTRYKRMRGFKTLWLPGTDHAGFETQVVYEKVLEKEGRSRFHMEKQELYDEVLKFTLDNKKNILEQVRRMGASCDWSREKFTLDPDIIRVVYDTFQRLAKDDLVYRGSRIVSWCTKHQTSFSDLEIQDEERTDKFYYLKYGPFVIGTSRPETKFGDKYVVTHPDDKRYHDYSHGQKLELEWINGPITATIIKDEAIDMTFGTGVMTITPWHDSADFDIAERHKLEKEQIIDFRGKLLPIAGEFEGMKIADAREKIMKKLQRKGLVEHIDENYKHVVHTCYKCGTLIEPQIMPQWFVRMKPLAEPAIKKIESGEIQFIPDHYRKIVLHWLNNINDWNISRQIVWGIPIPVWYCRDAHKHPEKHPDGKDWQILIDGDLSACQYCGSTNIEKETDTFDTWFSSGQWPFAALGYPDGADFKEFYPTDVMETAGEIIFFWVARMIMLSLYVTEKIPFKLVYLHGLVLDAKGKKMSKSRGNVINPLDLTDNYGTDALRMALVVGNTPGTSLALAEVRIKGYKHFVNKIWNAARFTLMNVGNFDISEKVPLSENDEKILEELGNFVKDVTENMDANRFYIAAEKNYHYFWHTFADKIIESAKPRLISTDVHEKRAAEYVLVTVLLTTLKTLHPFVPFITEHVWGLLPKAHDTLLLVEPWPQY